MKTPAKRKAAVTQAAPAANIPAEASEGGAILNFDDLDEVLGFHVRQAQGTMHRRVIAVLARVELTQKHAATLWLIGANPGTSQIALGGALRMDRATTMAIIDKLEGRGLVVRQRSLVDRRRHELFLTPAGQKMLVKVKSLIKEHERQFADRFTQAVLATLVSLLQRIYV
ncbi:MAG: MarR family winged helix-turn-helix transcriptional regulator [Caulobacter sp.]